MCVSVKMLTVEFSAGVGGGAEKLDAGKRTTERESFLFLVVPR